MDGITPTPQNVPTVPDKSSDEVRLPDELKLICDGNEDNLVVYSMDRMVSPAKKRRRVDRSVATESGGNQKDGKSIPTKAQGQQSESVSGHLVNSPTGLDQSDIGQPERILDSTEIKELNKAVLEAHVKASPILCLSNPPVRDGKKLLVLDIDHTLYDDGPGLLRPSLHQFLKAAYVNYDIAIWSATPPLTVFSKLEAMGVLNHPSYDIACMLDISAMIEIDYSLAGEPEKNVKVKPLCVLWNYIPSCSQKNTIMIDDMQKNFKLNPQCGLCIEAYHPRNLEDAEQDTMLVELEQYLNHIANVKDFTTLDHSAWRNYGVRVTTELKT
ncbi:unnamed protein product [Orchesella dallaii]|uniref:FCP1 homology domain-containing protein n=1 Tax=Orchesella dallaii TaxID=48710 RepID=A0ABP1PVW7_9HEXA